MHKHLRVNFLLWFFIPAMMLAPCYTYYMAVSKGEQKPYPHATITSTACHYPQDIIFRFVMLISSSVLALLFYITFRWLTFQAERIGFPTLPKWHFYLAQFSILCYGITIGTIDGKGIGKLHGPCAVIFFVVWLITLVNVTLYMIKLRHYDTSVIGWWSLWLKKGLIAYVLLVWIYCLVMIGLEQFTNHQDIYVVIVEWNSVMVNLLWVLSLVPQFRRLGLTLK